MTRRKNDILWKGMLEEVFDDLIRFVLPNADRLFDLKKKAEFLDKELAEMYPEPHKRSDTRFVDKLAKIHQKDGKEEWVLCHVEVQGKHDPEFAKRMFKYYCRIFDRYDRPMTAIAIFTGKDGKRLPGMYMRKYAGTQMTYKYNTLCILDYNDKNLAESKNPFAFVMLAAKKTLLKGKDLDEVLLKEKLQIANILIKKGFDEDKTNSILSFLYNYVRFANPETTRNFDQEIDRLTGKSNTMGIIEQVKQMKIEAARLEAQKAEKIETIKRMLARHFRIKDIAEIAGVTPAFVQKLKKAAQ